jgi:hypothetical protein
MVDNNTSLSQKSTLYKCDCGNVYKYDSGYYRHKKNCSQNNTNPSNESTDKESIIIMLLKQNTQLIEQNSELMKKYGTPVT